MKIGIINGPNLNLLGLREPDVYGKEGFGIFFNDLKTIYPSIEFIYIQSNIEGELINALHKFAFEDFCTGILLNAGGYTHTSVALHDAIKAVSIPVIEIHISNTAAREEFRHTSIIGSACKGCISGFGLKSYKLGIDALLECL